MSGEDPTRKIDAILGQTSILSKALEDRVKAAAETDVCETVYNTLERLGQQAVQTLEDMRKVIEEGSREWKK